MLYVCVRGVIDVVISVGINNNNNNVYLKSNIQTISIDCTYKPIQ